MSETVWWSGAWVLLALFVVGSTVLLRRIARGGTKQTPTQIGYLFLIQWFWGGWLAQSMMTNWTAS